MPGHADPFTLEKLKISERLAILEQTMINCQVQNCKIVERLEENLNKLNHIIIGNGEPGVSEKIRSLEDAEKNRRTHVKVFYGGIIAGFGDWLWRNVIHHILK